MTDLVERVRAALHDAGLDLDYANVLAGEAIDAVHPGLLAGTHVVVAKTFFDELDRLTAEQAAVEGLLWGLPENDAVGHLAFTRRLENTKEAIRNLVLSAAEDAG